LWRRDSGYDDVCSDEATLIRRGVDYDLDGLIDVGSTTRIGRCRHKLRENCGADELWALFHLAKWR
jgi:hypothetical protein